MIAYHMIGLETMDQGRLGSQSDDPVVVAQIVERVQQRYEQVVSAGILRPADKSVKEKTRLFFEDHLAGDDQYVFLSVGRRYWIEYEQLNFGFLFDAIALIKQGAILRKQDLLSDYEDLLSEIVAARTGFREPTEWSEEEQAALFEALEKPDEYPNYVGPNDAYYNLLDAAHALNYEVPGVAGVIEQFHGQVQVLHLKAQLTGKDAIAFIEESVEGGQCELLVHGQLPLSQAIGFIESGKIRRIA